MELEVGMIDIEKNGVQWFAQWNLEDLVIDIIMIGEWWHADDIDGMDGLEDKKIQDG